MSNENIENIMREFVGALYKRDLDKALSLCAEDADWVTPEGTYRGREEIKRYWTWVMQINSDLACKDSGIGIIAQGNNAVYEHLVSGTTNRMKYQMPVMCVYEFSDGKIQHIRTVYDRLIVAKQAAKGSLAKWLVNSIVKQAEKGLH